jgi:hypothetical protein
MRFALALLLLACTQPMRAAEYGAKGIYPVYETGGQWVIFDKSVGKAKAGLLAQGSRFLVVGSAGVQLFTVARNAESFGGACRNKKPVKLRTALLKGPRAAVGTPIVGIRVPANFSLKGSRARHVALGNEVNDDTYAKLGEVVRAAAVADMQSGTFKAMAPEEPGKLPHFPKPEEVLVKIDFGARILVRGLADAFAFVDAAQAGTGFRRCLRLADDNKLISDCVEMPHALLAETALLRFEIGRAHV